MAPDAAPSDEVGDINVVPFLDIITNVLMFVLATVAVSFTSTIDVSVGGRGPRPPISPTLDLTVLVVDGGYALKTRGGNVATGCASAGVGLAIPKTSTGYDYEGLRRCASKLKSSSTDFASEHAITVSASPQIPYDIVIATVDAVRTAPSGDELFPDVAFAIAR